jgi:hypothetical protein
LLVHRSLWNSCLTRSFSKPMLNLTYLNINWQTNTNWIYKEKFNILQYKFKVIRYIYATQVRSDQVSDCLISGHLGFRIVRVRIGSNFGSFDLGSSRISSHSGSDRSGQVSDLWSPVISDFRVVWVRIGSDFGLSNLESSQIRVVRVRVRSSSGQFDFLKKSNRIRFRSERVSRISQIWSNFSTSTFYKHTPTVKIS